MKKLLKKMGRAIVKGAIFVFCKVAYRAEIIGTENIPKEGALIFCGNHRNYLDPPLMVVTSRRFVHFMAKEELSHNKFLAFLGRAFEAIYVKRDSKDLVSIKEALKVLKQGECIALFPEGTRNGLEKGEKVKDGASFFALRTGAKVIPVGITGGMKLLEKVTIHYGEPLDFSQYGDKKQDKEVLDKVTEEIMEQILQLTKQEK